MLLGVRVDTIHLFFMTWLTSQAPKKAFRLAFDGGGWVIAFHLHLKCHHFDFQRLIICVVSSTATCNQMITTTVTDCSRAVYPFASAASTSSARGRSSSFLRFGAPRFNEDFIRVHRCDDHGMTHDLSLYYRVYNPSFINSQESPPLIVLHGGP